MSRTSFPHTGIYQRLLNYKSFSFYYLILQSMVPSYLLHKDINWTLTNEKFLVK